MTLDLLPLGDDVQLPDATEVVCGAWQSAWTIPPPMSVSQWADATRYIAKGAGAEPGKWHTSRTPYLREIMDALSEHSPVREVSFQKSAQIGATEVGINWSGYVIDRALDSMIVAQPVKDLARSWSASKFEPAMQLMPEVLGKLTSDNTLEKAYPGGTLWVIWTNSSNQLRQRTARHLFEDELDEYPDDLGGQGGADEQLEARAMSYGDRAKIYRACTPTWAGRSKINKAFLAGDQRRYMLPCPECGTHQVLKIENLLPSGTFACVANGCEISDHHKSRMLRERSACAGCGEVPVRMVHQAAANGRHTYADHCDCSVVVDPPTPDGAYWSPTAAADSASRSYHIWAAYTPDGLGLTWREIADKRAEAERDPSKQAGFANLVCGEVFQGERQQQDANEVMQLAEAGVHLGTVPDGSLVLTAGVDCQHDRFEATVLGWGRGQRVRVVDYAVLDGDPSTPDGYAELEAWLKGTWLKRNGRSMLLQSIAIDGGNWTEMVAQFVRKLVGQSGQARMLPVGQGFGKQAVYLVRGRSEKTSPRAVYRPAKTEVNQREKTIARSVGVWGVGTSVLKHIIHGWLSSAIAAQKEAEKVDEPEDVSLRMIRFPGGRGEPPDPLRPDPGALSPAYYDGLTCEYFDLDAKAWTLPRGKRNEPLDTMVYGFWAALAPAVGIDKMREPQWAELELRLEPPVDLFSPAPVAVATDSSPRETSTGAEWVGTVPRIKLQ